MSDIKCDECGEPISEDEDVHGCDFCEITMCDSCVLFWSDEEIGDDGKCCSECCEEKQNER